MSSALLLPASLLAPRTATTISDTASIGYIRPGVSIFRSKKINTGTANSVSGATAYPSTFLKSSPSSWPRISEQLKALRTLEPDWDGYGAPKPSPVAIRAAWTVVARAFERGIAISDVLPSAEGGVYIAFQGSSARRANIECFNSQKAYGATVSDKVDVWPVQTIDRSDLDAAIQRIREYLAPA